MGRVALRTLALAAALAAGSAVPAAAAAAERVSGTFESVYADDFASGKSTVTYELDRGDDTVQLLPTEEPDAATGQRVTVVGEQQDGRLVGEVRGRAAATALGNHRVAVVLFNFASDQRQPWAPAEVHQRIFTNADSTAAFFAEQSYGQIAVTGDVYGWYTIPAAPMACGSSYDGWSVQARAQAEAAGVDLGAYDHVMYVFPPVGGCGFAGAAHVNGPLSWINGDLRVRVVAHELGHNLGLHHAASLSCTGPGGGPAALSASCAMDDYGDRWDVMGAYGHRHSHAWHLERLGILAPQNVRAVSASGTYHLRSALAPSGEVTALRVPRRRAANGTALDWLSLEIRESGGVFDAFSPLDPATRGVSIRLVDDPSRTTRSRLIDATPGSSAGMADAPLPPGATFNDTYVSVRTVSAGSGRATVEVDLAPPPADVTPPTAPGAVRTGKATRGVRLSWSPSVDDVGVAGYAIFRDGVEVRTTTSTALSDTAAGRGWHAYEVAAFDAAGNRSERSRPVTATVSGRAVGDRVPPRIRLRRTRGRGGKVVLKAVARDDRRVRRVELWIDGRRRATRRGATLRHSWRPRRGRHAVVARAVDTSGNRASKRLRVKR
jgi:gametolysin peptidase M11